MFKRYLLLLATLGVISNVAPVAFAQTTCTVRSIVVPGAAGTSAYGVNRYDTVVGVYQDNTTFQLRAYRWSNGSITKYLVPGAKNTQFRGINDKGDIVGSYWGTDNHNHGLVRSGGKYITFNYPGAYNTFGMGINNYGTIVGWFTKSVTGAASGFRKTSTGWTTLRFPNSTATWASSISDTGVIAGWYQDATGRSHGFTYKSGIYTNVDFPGANSTAVHGVNKYSNLVGPYQSAKDQPVQAWQRKGGNFSTFTWQNAVSISLDGINNLGDEVGSAGLANSEPGFLRVCR